MSDFANRLPQTSVWRTEVEMYDSTVTRFKQEVQTIATSG